MLRYQRHLDTCKTVCANRKAVTSVGDWHTRNCTNIANGSPQTPPPDMGQAPSRPTMPQGELDRRYGEFLREAWGA